MKYILTLLLFFSCYCVFGQNRIPEKNQIKTLYESIDKRISAKNLEGIEDSIDSLNVLSAEKKDTLYLFLSRILKATLLYNKKKFDLAEKILEKGRHELKFIKPSPLKDSLLVKYYSTFAHFYYRKNDYPDAVKNYIEQLKIGKKLNDSLSVRSAYNYLGMIYIHKKSYKDAINQFNEALKYCINKYSKHDLYGNIGTAHYYLKDYGNAEKYILKSTEYINPKNNIDLFSSYTNLGAITLRNKKKDKALNYHLKAYEVSKKINSKEKKSKALANLGVFYSTTGENKKAKKFIRKADSTANYVNSITYKRKLYLNLFKSSKRLKDYKSALLFFEKHVKFKDSLLNKKNKKTIEELHLAYKTEQNQDKIKNQKALIISEKNKNTLLLVGLVLILISMLFMFLSYRKRLLAQKELADEKMSSVLERQKVKTYESHIEGQNKERKRISQELHDGILGRLFGTRIALGFVQCKEEDVNNQKLFLEELQHIEADIRDVSHRINDEIEETELNFYNNVNQLLKKTCFTGNFDFVFNASKDIEWEFVSGLVRINLYRILQESLQNIIKHAQAKQVILDFSLSKDQLVMQITDNGVGFSTTENNEGIGIKNIASRVNDINGILDITSKKGEGTTIHISIPYESI